MAVAFRTLALVILVVAAPSALASWSARGGAEPDTLNDAADGWMYTTPDVDPDQGVREVFFHGFLSQCSSIERDCWTVPLNPNSGLAGSAIDAYPERAFAMLGVWKDCNGDGFVGLGDQGLLEYRSELLLDGLTHPSICAPQPLPSVPPPAHGFPVHNDGQTVREFLPIGYPHFAYKDTWPKDPDAFDVEDPAARVWMDLRAPGDPPVPICNVAPAPRDTFRDAGGVIDAADCYLGQRANDAEQEAIDTAGIRPQYDTIRAVHDPWGHQTDAAYVQPTYRCWTQPGARPIVGARVGNVAIEAHDPTLSTDVNAAGSPAGQIDELSAETDGCRPYSGDVRGDPNARGHTLSEGPYLLEADVRDSHDPRTGTDATLFYQEGTRSDQNVGERIVLGASQRSDAGTGLDAKQGYWAASRLQARVLPAPLVDRDALVLSAPRLVTFYASIGSDARTTFRLSLPRSPHGSPLTTGTYGAEACQGATTGIHANWECDPGHWYGGSDHCQEQHGNARTYWIFGDGQHSDVINGQCADLAARVGDAYELRDVDCYDDSTILLRSLGIGDTILTGDGGNCAPPSSVASAKPEQARAVVPQDGALRFLG